MLNCKIGDRAMIIHRDNYGKQCIILANCTDFKWLVQTLEPAKSCIGIDIIKVPAGYKGFIGKEYVIPLSDPDQNIIETNKELETT
jgi:hypothetical protein